MLFLLHCDIRVVVVTNILITSKSSKNQYPNLWSNNLRLLNKELMSSNDNNTVRHHHLLRKHLLIQFNFFFNYLCELRENIVLVMTLCMPVNT